MKNQLILLIPLCIVIVLSACQKSDYKEVQQYTIQQFMNTTSIGGSSFSADEKSILFSSDASGIFNAFIIPVEGGEAKQITQSTTT